MRNEIIDHRLQGEREIFIHTIDPKAICRLASSYHKNEHCRIFREPSHGSFNLCFYVAFVASGDRWVVRIPIVPCLSSVDEKLTQEVAAMKCVAEKTNIPLPRTHAYSFQDRSPIGLAFLIIDFVEGKTLHDINIGLLSGEQKVRLYEQLADIEVQLRRLEFPHISALSIEPESEAQWTSRIPRRPFSIELNGQEIEGIPTLLLDDNGKEEIYTSANEYIRSLVDLGFQQFQRGRNSVEDEYDATVALYNLHQFRDIVEDWLKEEFNHGPFVLMHGDLRPPNIILDGKFDIVAVIDWEWSRIVPLQLFVPPTWLTAQEVRGICSSLHLIHHSLSLFG